MHSATHLIIRYCMAPHEAPIPLSRVRKVLKEHVPDSFVVDRAVGIVQPAGRRGQVVCRLGARHRRDLLLRPYYFLIRTMSAKKPAAKFQLPSLLEGPLPLLPIR